ncbi:MAG: ATP-binding cassette domain-containing protein [Bradymonadaceae bacterium]
METLVVRMIQAARVSGSEVDMAEQSDSESSPAIVVDDVVKTYGDFKALDGVDFEVGSGEIVGFLGPNGAGKTTTMKILTSYMAATEGTAEVAGYDVHESPHDVRRVTGYLPENVPLYEGMLTHDYLNFIAEVRGVPPGERDERIDRVTELAGLEAVIHREIFELSKGYRQRVGLAQTLIHQPEVIILDEPTTGLDPNQIVDIRDVITGIGQEKTIILSTHILQEVSAVCDRVVIINEGQIVADDELEALEEAVAQTEPGLRVSFEPAASSAELEAMLKDLPAVQSVVEEPGREGEHLFRLETDDEDTLRRALFEEESQNDHGLSGLTRTRPSLEDVFRVFTEGSTEEKRAAS